MSRSLLCRGGGKGISGGGDSMNKDPNMWRSVFKKQGGKGRLSQRPPESQPQWLSGVIPLSEQLISGRWLRETKPLPGIRGPAQYAPTTLPAFNLLLPYSSPGHVPRL